MCLKGKLFRRLSKGGKMKPWLESVIVLCLLNFPKMEITWYWNLWICKSQSYLLFVERLESLLGETWRWQNSQIQSYTGGRKCIKLKAWSYCQAITFVINFSGFQENEKSKFLINSLQSTAIPQTKSSRCFKAHVKGTLACHLKLLFHNYLYFVLRLM